MTNVRYCKNYVIYIYFFSTESWTEWRLDHLVCWLYTNCLRYLPVLVRQWWSSADSRVSAAVDKITTIYVSPFLCNEELHDNRLANVENMQVYNYVYINLIKFFKCNIIHFLLLSHLQKRYKQV